MSSQRYPQTNGEAERMAQTVKKLLTKSEDPYQGLLSYCSAPLSNGYSPAELLMGRQLRSLVPTTPATLLPKQVPYREVQVKEKVQRERQKRNLTNIIEPKNYHHYLKEKKFGFLIDQREGQFYSSLQNRDCIYSSNTIRRIP